MQPGPFGPRGGRGDVRPRPRARRQTRRPRPGAAPGERRVRPRDRAGLRAGPGRAAAPLPAADQGHGGGRGLAGTSPARPAQRRARGRPVARGRVRALGPALRVGRGGRGRPVGPGRAGGRARGGTVQRPRGLRGPAHRIRPTRPRPGARRADDPGRGRDDLPRADGQLHQGLLHRPGAGGPTGGPGQPGAPPPVRSRPRVRGGGRGPGRGRARRPQRRGDGQGRGPDHLGRVVSRSRLGRAEEGGALSGPAVEVRDLPLVAGPG